MAPSGRMVEREVPLGFHEGAGSQLRQVGEQSAGNAMLKHVYCHPVGS